MSEIKVYYGKGQFISSEADSLLFDGEKPSELILKSDHDQKVKLLEAALEKCKDQREFLRKNYVGYWGNPDEIDAKVKILVDADDAELDLILNKPSEG